MNIESDQAAFSVGFGPSGARSKQPHKAKQPFALLGPLRAC